MLLLNHDEVFGREDHRDQGKPRQLTSVAGGGSHKIFASNDPPELKKIAPGCRPEVKTHVNTKKNDSECTKKLDCFATL
jgi:hypothetical protein